MSSKPESNVANTKWRPALIEAQFSPSSDNCAAACEVLLQEQLANASNVLGAVMASIDGHAMASAFRPGHENTAARIAAIGSSVLALSESLSHETLKGQVQFNSVSTNGGTIVTVKIPSQKSNHALCVWADKADIFAMTLRFTLDAASKLAALVDEDH